VSNNLTHDNAREELMKLLGRIESKMNECNDLYLAGVYNGLELALVMLRESGD
jgi:hypothetical protein